MPFSLGQNWGNSQAFHVRSSSPTIAQATTITRLAVAVLMGARVRIPRSNLTESCILCRLATLTNQYLEALNCRSDNIQRLAQMTDSVNETTLSFAGLENRRRLVAFPGFESLTHRHFNDLRVFRDFRITLYIPYNIQMYIILLPSCDSMP